MDESICSGGFCTSISRFARPVTSLRVFTRCIRLPLWILGLLLIGGWLPAQSSGEADLALVGGRLIDGFGGPPVDDTVILIRQGVIIDVGIVGVLEVPRGAAVIDTNGMTVLPGLWESHGHLQIFGAGAPPAVFESRHPELIPEVIRRVAAITLRAGITSFRDLGGSLEELKKAREQIRSGTLQGPRIYLAGPTLHQGEPESTLPDTPATPEQARERVRQLVAAGVDQISVDGFWDPAVLQALVEEAHQAGKGVDAGVRHISAYRVAMQAGVDRLHTVFVTDPLSDYSPEELRWLVRGERPLASGPSANILRGPYIIPGLEIREAYVRALRFPEALDHPRFRKIYGDQIYAYLKETWQQPQSIPWGVGAIPRMEVVKRKVRAFIDAGGREQLVAGTDAGSPLNAHSPIPREIADLVEVGLTPMEAIQAATLRPAQMQGVGDRLGAIAAGRLADLIVVDGNPLEDISLLQHELVHVVKAGQVIF